MWGYPSPLYRHPEHSRGIFLAAAFLIPALIRLHETLYPQSVGKQASRFRTHTYTPFYRQRKRILTFARNDTQGRITSHRLSHRHMVCKIIPPSYRHPERSRGIFVAATSSPALLIHLHETPYPTFMEYQASRFRSHAYTVWPRTKKISRYRSKWHAGAWSTRIVFHTARNVRQTKKGSIKERIGPFCFLGHIKHRNRAKVKRSCEEMRIYFFTAAFLCALPAPRALENL